jgi:hypothetical protein
MVDRKTIFRRQNEQREVCCHYRRVAGVLQAQLLNDRQSNQGASLHFVCPEDLGITLNRRRERGKRSPPPSTPRHDENGGECGRCKREEIAFCTKMKRKLLNKLF